MIVLTLSGSRFLRKTLSVKLSCIKVGQISEIRKINFLKPLISVLDSPAERISKYDFDHLEKLFLREVIQ